MRALTTRAAWEQRNPHTTLEIASPRNQVPRLMLKTIFILLLFAGALRAAGNDAPDIPSGSAGHFPGLKASSLEGQSFDLPGDFKGDRNLLFIAFEREQQTSIDTW